MVWQVARKEEDIAERDKTILPPSERDPNSKVLSRQFVNDHVNLCEAYAAPHHPVEYACATKKIFVSALYFSMLLPSSGPCFPDYPVQVNAQAPASHGGTV